MTAAPDLFAAPANELPASHLRPGDAVRRGPYAFAVERVEVSAATVTIQCRRRPGAAPEALTLVPGEIVRIVS